MRAAVRIRRLTGMCAALAVLLAVPAGTAVAAPFTGSTVTAPGPDARPVYDADLGPSAPTNQLSVTGTATGGDGPGELRCYSRDAADDLREIVVQPGPIDVTDGRFSTSLSTSGLTDVCRLRLVPDDAPALDDAAVEPFAGPRVLPAQRLVDRDVGDPAVITGLRFTGAAPRALGSWYGQAGAPAPLSLRVVDPDTLRLGASAFTGSASFVSGSEPDPAPPRIDGVEVMTPGPEGLLQRDFRTDAQGDRLTATESTFRVAQPFPPYPDAGVTAVRTVTTGAQGQTMTVEDRWRATDGKAHALDVTYAEGFIWDSDFRLSWTGDGFQPGQVPHDVAPPPGPVSTVSARAPGGAPGLERPLGAVTFSTRPDALRFADAGFLRATFRRTIPPAGALVIRHRFAAAVSESGLEQLTAANEAAGRLDGPRVGFTSPTRQAGFDPAYTLTGSTSTLGGVSSLVVNGQEVTPAPDGSFALPVTLAPGENTVTATVTDAQGERASTQATVLFTPPTASATYQRPTYRKGVISLPITCQALAGTGCVVRAKLTARFKRKVGRRARFKTVLLYGTTFRVPAQTSKTVTIRLSQRNRKLVRKYRRIRARLEVVQEGVTDAAGKPARRYWGVTLK